MSEFKPEPKPHAAAFRGFEVARFGRRWGIVYRLDESTSWDQHVRYATKREAVGMAALLNRQEKA